MNNVKLKFKKLKKEAIVPAYQSEGAAGFDLHAIIPPELATYNINEGKKVAEIKPGEMKPVPTGLAVEVPLGYELQVRPRSGLAAKKHVTVLNSPGTVDSDYRGEIKVLLYNHGPSVYFVKQGDRIAQGVISAVPKVAIVEVDSLTETSRGSSGFGSTGT